MLIHAPKNRFMHREQMIYSGTTVLTNQITLLNIFGLVKKICFATQALAHNLIGILTAEAIVYINGLEPQDARLISMISSCFNQDQTHVGPSPQKQLYTKNRIDCMDHLENEKCTTKFPCGWRVYMKTKKTYLPSNGRDLPQSRQSTRPRDHCGGPGEDICVVFWKWLERPQTLLWQLSFPPTLCILQNESRR